MLFRPIQDGARDYRTGDAVSLPERLGALFDSDSFPFLESRPAGAGAGARQRNERVRPPLISDGAVYRVLEKLLVLDGERISYRTLDAVQIGSVYETIMCFRMEIATSRSIAIKPAKKLGAPSAVDLDALLEQGAGNRAKWLQLRTDRNLTEYGTTPIAADDSTTRGCARPILAALPHGLWPSSSSIRQPPCAHTHSRRGAMLPVILPLAITALRVVPNQRITPARDQVSAFLTPLEMRSVNSENHTHG